MANSEDRGRYKSLEPSPNAAFETPSVTNKSRSLRVLMKAAIIVFTAIILWGSYSILANRIMLMTLSRVMLPGAVNCSHSSAKVPQYFQTSPELWAGPTATGRAPFLAQTNPVSFAPTATFVPNNPLETAIPIVGQSQNESIFHLMGHLSPYFSNPSGFGYVVFLDFKVDHMITPKPLCIA